jgi:Bacterial Ig-like domain (group 3)
MVTFKDGAASIGTAAISGNAANFTINTLGVSTHTITATYGGDVNVTASNSGPVAQNVTQATTAATLASSVNPALVNESITFTATVVGQYGGAATGSVIFKAGPTKLGTITLSGNQASVTTSFSTAGARSITAQYVGDINDIGSTSLALNESVVAKFTTATVLTSSLNPSYVNQPVKFTATVSSASGAIPNGEVVTFTNGGATLGTGTTSGGVATLTTPSLTVASHNIKASYAGDSTFATSTSAAVTQVVSLYPTSTMLTVSPNPSAYGQSVTLKTTVTSSAPAGPTGTVTFKNGSTTLGTAALSAGTATLATTKLPVGSDAITATYNGDAQNAKGTSSPFTATVNPAVSTTSLTSSLNPSKSGQTVKFIATVTSPTTTPVGSVTFLDGSTTLATIALGSGKASYSTSALGTGTHNITAVYAGTVNITGSTSPTLVQTVN